MSPPDQGVVRFLQRVPRSVKAAALGRGRDAGAGSVVALVGQRGQSQQGGRGVERAEKAGGPDGGDVVCRSGLDVKDCDGDPSGSQTTCTLPPWARCLSENHRSWPVSGFLVRQRSVRISVPSKTTGVQPASLPLSSVTPGDRRLIREYRFDPPRAVEVEHEGRVRCRPWRVLHDPADPDRDVDE